MAPDPDWLRPGASVVLAKDFAPHDGLRFDRGLEGLVTAADDVSPSPSPP